jgi:hypothetical protein
MYGGHSVGAMSKFVANPALCKSLARDGSNNNNNKEETYAIGNDVAGLLVKSLQKRNVFPVGISRPMYTHSK